MSNINTDIDSLISILQTLLNQHGVVIQHKYADSVAVGDFLIYYKKETSQVLGGKVCAVGGEQPYGVYPGQRWIAVEGDPTVQKYLNLNDLLILCSRPID